MELRDADCHEVRSHPQDTSQGILSVKSSTSLTKEAFITTMSVTLRIRVYRLFYPEKFANETMFGDPDYEHVHQELKHVGVTLKLLHEEYVERCERNGEIPMGKTKFNEGYAGVTIANRLATISSTSPEASGSRLVRSDHALRGHEHRRTDHGLPVRRNAPYSQYSYVEPCLDMKMDTFIRCHIRMYEYFGGAQYGPYATILRLALYLIQREGKSS